LPIFTHRERKRVIKALQIYKVTNHIQRVVISRHLLGTR
jgi:alkylation response protein AidB-like acyl-CoA dehydrogenase